ncbi:hypothetical protein L596_023475 [Steinernema carpocapsae]|uniref:Uncharacterized protein n=1 Tax=Steinernema carpocapsae TaxID=34508 RepID=A0A4U5MDR8_STECR|nr:hypothetical protein L596_023475 [Steinernema carpocapsae]
MEPPPKLAFRQPTRGKFASSSFFAARSCLRKTEPRGAMIVHHSILVNSLIARNGDDHFQKIELETDPNEYSGFLMTVSNKLDLHRESCSTWESLLILNTNQQNISLACTNYLISFSDAMVSS